MKRVIIIDDELDAIDNLSLLIKEITSDILIVQSFDNGIDATQYLKSSNSIDAIFLDINMPQINGFGFLDLIDHRELDVIFVSAEKQHALDAIDFRPFAYLLKPLDIEKLTKVCLDLTSTASKTINTEGRTKLKIPTQSGYQFIELNKILRIKANRSYCNILLESGKEIIVSQSLKKTLTNVSNKNIFRCHKSYAINLKKVTGYTRNNGGFIVLDNGEEIPISASYKNDFFSYIENM